MPLVCCRHSVTWPDSLRWISVEPLGPGLAQLPSFPGSSLAGYRGLTREAYALDLRQFTSWCRSRSLSLFSVRRAGIESFARQLEASGRARAAVTRRLSTIAGFCKYAVEEELLDHSPMSGGRGPATSLMRPRWTVTSPARCWWPPGSARLWSTRLSPCWP
jgi:Phage integrase, N-terminal SAM-like domain